MERVSAQSSTLLLSNVASLLIAFFIVPFLARLLGPRDYGLYQLTFAIVAIVSLPTDFGFYTSLTNSIAKCRAKGLFQKARKIIVIVAKILVSISIPYCIMCFFLTGPIAINFFKMPDLKIPLQIVIFYIFLNVIFNIFQSISYGTQCLEYHALVKMFSDFIRFAFILFLLLLKFGLLGAIYGTILALVVADLLYFVVYLKFIRRFLNGPEDDYEQPIPLIRGILSYGLPVWCSAIFIVVLSNLNFIFLGKFAVPSEVGYYSVATRVAGLLFVPVSVLSFVLFPTVADLFSRNHIDLLERGFQKLTKFLAYLVIPLVMITIFLSNSIIRVLFSHEYMPAALILAVLAFSVLFQSFAAIMNSFFFGLGLVKNTVVVYVSVTAIAFVVNLFVIPQFGGIGAAASAVLANFFEILLFVYFLRRKLHLKAKLDFFIKPLIASAPALALLSVLPIRTFDFLWIFVSCTFFAVSYVVLLILLRGFDTDDLRIFEKQAKNSRYLKGLFSLLLMLIRHLSV